MYCPGNVVSERLRISSVYYTFSISESVHTSK
jgi:hypothetical protein